MNALKALCLITHKEKFTFFLGCSESSTAGTRVLHGYFLRIKTNNSLPEMFTPANCMHQTFLRSL
jgi:hypothetical protein